MVTSNLDPRAYKSWELDPSTRDSVHLFTKAYPIDATLTVSGTAQDLIAVSPGLPTVNLVTNPSAETGSPPTGYTALKSATLAQDGTYYKYGTKSLKITPPNSAKGEGAYWNLGNFSNKDPLAISAYFTRGAGSGSDARIELVASTIVNYASYTNVRIAVGNTITLDTNWQRSELVSVEPRFVYILTYAPLTGTFVEDETITGGTSGATATVMTVGSTWLVISAPSSQFRPEYGVYATEAIAGTSSGATGTVTAVTLIPVTGNLRLHFVTATKHATVFYVDGIQAEVSYNVTAYADGDQGHSNFWDGTSHASTSRRWRKLSNIRSYRFHTTRDIYLAYDRVASRTATNAEDKGEFIPAGTDFGEDHPIHLDSKMSFINANIGEQPRVYGVAWGI